MWYYVANRVSFFLKKGIISAMGQLYLCLKLSRFCINDKIITLICFLYLFLSVNTCKSRIHVTTMEEIRSDSSDISNTGGREMSSSGNV